jgi:hypothetical protein
MSRTILHRRSVRQRRVTQRPEETRGWWRDVDRLIAERRRQARDDAADTSHGDHGATRPAGSPPGQGRARVS